MQQLDRATAQRPLDFLGRYHRLTSLLIGVVWLIVLGVFNQQVAAWTLANLLRLLAIVGVAALVWVLPGLALLRLLWRDHALGGLERFAMACGISFALPPLLFEIANLLGLPWNRWTTLLYVAVAAALLVGRSPRVRLRALTIPAWSWHATALTGMLVAALSVQLFVIRDLPVGMWGDSYHHTMITQLLVDQQGLFSSWQPYAPLTTFTYHFGFHSNAALLHWLTGFEVAQSVLVMGQIFSVGSIVAAYGLTSQISGRPTAGLWAALLTGFVNVMPVYFVNWGRYTQIAGQNILPVLLLCWLAILAAPRPGWRRMLLTALISAGLLLTHYIIMVLAGAFILAYALARQINRPNWPQIKQMLVVGGLVSGATLLLTAPWIINLTSGYWDNFAASTFAPRNPALPALNLVLEPLVPRYIKGEILLLAVLGAGVALARREKRILLGGLWNGVMFFLVAFNLFGLPGAGLVKPSVANLGIYIFIIPLAAYLLSWLQEHAWLAARSSKIWINGLATLLIITTTAWGMRWQSQIIDPQYQLFTPADSRAMEWIRRETAQDARFLVNAFPSFNDHIIVGDDGGWWIPLLTGRQSTLPPATYGAELAETPTYRQEINALNATLRTYPLALPLTQTISLNAIQQAGVDYIYIGPHIGSAQRFDITALRKNTDLFRKVYEQEGVIIFALEDAQ